MRPLSPREIIEKCVSSIRYSSTSITFKEDCEKNISKALLELSEWIEYRIPSEGWMFEILYNGHDEASKSMARDIRWGIIQAIITELKELK